MGKNEDFGVVVCNGRFRVFKNGEILKIKGGKVADYFGVTVDELLSDDQQ